MKKARILAVSLLAACGSNGGGRGLQVTQVPGALGTAQLQWSIPTQREDSSEITNLAGFNVYFGTAPGLYTDEIRIENPSVDIWIVDSLEPGSTYYFAVTAFDSDELESDFSNEVSKAIQ